jgi:hypothetical protein
MPAQLRLYDAPFDEQEDDAQAPSIRVRLADLLPLLATAKRNNYLWLHDFLQDEVAVTSDLYDVLRSFSTVRQPSA